MKLLLSQERNLRCDTLDEIQSTPSKNLSLEESRLRNQYLQAQIKHSFHINNQLSNALSEQFLIIQNQDQALKQLQDEITYLRNFTLTRFDNFRADIKSSFDSALEYKPDC